MHSGIKLTWLLARIALHAGLDVVHLMICWSHGSLPRWQVTMHMYAVLSDGQLALVTVMLFLHSKLWTSHGRYC